MKIKLFKKQNNFKKKDFVFHLNFYWRIIILCAIVMVFSSFLFGYRFFVKINQRPVSQFTNKESMADALNQNNILKALNYFSEKERRSNEILNSPSMVVDPSL